MCNPFRRSKLWALGFRPADRDSWVPLWDQRRLREDAPGLPALPCFPTRGHPSLATRGTRCYDWGKAIFLHEAFKGWWTQSATSLTLPSLDFFTLPEASLWALSTSWGTSLDSPQSSPPPVNFLTDLVYQASFLWSFLLLLLSHFLCLVNFSSLKICFQDTSTQAPKAQQKMSEGSSAQLRLAPKEALFLIS